MMKTTMTHVRACVKFINRGGVGVYLRKYISQEETNILRLTVTNDTKNEMLYSQEMQYNQPHRDVFFPQSSVAGGRRENISTTKK